MANHWSTAALQRLPMLASPLQVSKALRVPEATIRRRLRDGSIPYEVDGRRFLVPRLPLRSYLQTLRSSRALLLRSGAR